MLKNALILFDDIDAAGRHLSDLGKEVLIGVAAELRDTLVRIASARGWATIRHSAFADWVDDVADSRCKWLTLDPLIDVDELAPYASAVRVSRVLHDTGWRVEAEAPQAIEQMARGIEVGIVDDASVTGSTVAYVAEKIRGVGGIPIHLALGCASWHARELLSKRLAGVTLSQFVEGGSVAIHMRDACPYLPFSGRPSAGHAPVATPAGLVEVRFPSLTRKSGLWASLLADYRALAASVQARTAATVRFSERLGRDAIVADLPLLGKHVSLPAFPRHQVTAETTLASIC